MQRWATLLAPGSTVLDVACGSGRHVRWLAGQGHRVTGVDRDAAALQALHGLPGVVAVEADLEGAPWPLPGQRFDAVVVTHYLWRPLWPALIDSLAEGGLLVYETFADGQQHLGKPSRAEFLLQPGELWRRCADLRVLAFEDGLETGAEGPGRCVQRIAALRRPAQIPALAAPGQPATCPLPPAVAARAPG